MLLQRQQLMGELLVLGNDEGLGYIIGTDEGTELGSPDGSFDGSNEGKPDGSLLGA